VQPLGEHVGVVRQLDPGKPETPALAKNSPSSTGELDDPMAGTTPGSRESLTARQTQPEPAQWLALVVESTSICRMDGLGPSTLLIYRHFPSRTGRPDAPSRT
jgi:hypothetical protein